MEQQHTPGPWAEYRSTKYLGRGFTSTPVDIWHVNGDGDTTHVADGIGTVMDARLIAAAPDLLAALEAARNWIGEFGLNDEGLVGLAADMDAAIRKARGE